MANLPITLYPGMKIGQISFLQMTTPADVPYGSAEVGSKYQGQRRPDAEPLLGELHLALTPALGCRSCPMSPVLWDMSATDPGRS